MTEQTLSDDLRALGRAAGPEVDADLFAGRVAGALPAPSPRRPRVGRRVGLAALAVVVALVATPPVRATVAEWFGFGAVRVEPGEAPRGEPAVPPVEGGSALSGAAGRTEFGLVAPRALGEPDGVEVGSDGRRASLSWGSGEATVRLDQYAGTPDYAVVKAAPRMRFVTVDGRDALWFPTAHRFALLDEAGDRAAGFRVADRTLVVPLADSTVRIEGRLTLAEAIDLARSLRPVG